MAVFIGERFLHPGQIFDSVEKAVAQRIPHRQIAVPVDSKEPQQTTTPVLNKLREIENREVYNLGRKEDRKITHHIVYEDRRISGFEPSPILGFETVLENPLTGGRRVIDVRPVRPGGSALRSGHKKIL